MKRQFALLGAVVCLINGCSNEKAAPISGGEVSGKPDPNEKLGVSSVEEVAGSPAAGRGLAGMQNSGVRTFGDEHSNDGARSGALYSTRPDRSNAPPLARDPSRKFSGRGSAPMAIRSGEVAYEPRMQTMSLKGNSIGTQGRGAGGAAYGPATRARMVQYLRVPPPSVDEGPGSEQYVHHGYSSWFDPRQDRLSTFAVDVDTASYTLIRRKLRQGQLPPPSSVRVEEFVNYFRYDDRPPREGPVAVYLEAAPSPFDDGRKLLRIALKAREVEQNNRKPAHLTFLVDTSGSMSSYDKLPLVKQALRFLVDQLGPMDSVALCTYAGSIRKVLDPTGMEERSRIHEAIENLSAGGSTAMSSGLELAYKLAYYNIQGDAVNRVIVLSDGDANVGRTAHGDMLASIKHFAEEGVTLSTIGFGTGNYKDHKMEQLADKGNGNYYYIDSFAQAKRVFGQNLLGTLQVVAKDVKIQVEFEPGSVKRYRLVGYENRDIADRDFRNDKVDAGEMGAGHSVTAIYEVELASDADYAGWATARVRYKEPHGVKAMEVAFALNRSDVEDRFRSTSSSFRRAVAAAALAENLRLSPFADSWTMAKAKQIARQSLERENAEELELIELIQRAAQLL